MRHLLTIAFVLIGSSLTFAQFGGGRGGSAPSIVGKISGKVIDESTGDPVEYATVVLQLADFAKDVDGVISDEKGKFSLENIKPGTYNVVISFIGYEEKSIRDVTTTKKKPDLDLGEITLGVDNVLLDAVEITETGPLLENKPDRLVYNAEQDATNSGGDASDVLRKVPMLSVDLEGNVSLRGSQNIRVLLNGKPSSMFSDNLAEALKAIPSDQIKKVEVITSPSAKYEGEGSGGIINIITKKKNLEGMFASVNASVGTRQNNGGLTFNAKKGRLGFTSSGYTYASWPVDAPWNSLRESFTDAGTISYGQTGSRITNRIGFFGKAGLEYDINAYNSLQSSFSLRGFKSNSDDSSEGLRMAASNVLEDFRRTSDGGDLRSGYEWSTNYTKTFKKKEQELSVSYRLDGNITQTDRDVARIGAPLTSDYDELLDNEGDNLEQTMSIDYTHPFSKNFKLEVGTKAILRDIDSDYKYNVLENGAYNEDPLRSNLFNYDQDVASGYVSFNINLKNKWSIVTGVRYEATSIKGQFRDDISPFDEEYDNWFPNFNISKQFKDFSSIKFGWSNRIQRPSLFFVNPFVQSEDRLNVTVGNPTLNPETSSQYEVGYSAFKNGKVLNLSVFYRQTEDLIQRFTTVSDNDISKNTYENLGTDNAVGFNVFASVTIKKNLTLRSNLNYNTFTIKSTIPGVDLSNSGSRYNAFFQAALDLKKDWKVEGFGFFNAPEQTLQGENPSFWMYSVGFRKDIWDKKGSIGFRAVDPFNERKLFASNLEDDSFRFRSEFFLPFRSIGINFSYKIGSLKLQQRDRGPKNDDQKQGGDGGQQGGGGPQG